jgi:ketosteroid isomerase-like protein
MIFEDRQGFARLSGGSEMQIASLRERLASGSHARGRLMGTAGERVAVLRMLWSGGPSDGRFEIENLVLIEVDEAGLVSASILCGADDARGAQREAWARWTAIDPSVAATVALVGEANDAFNAQDRARLRALFADDIAVDDHRRTGMGRLDGGDAYVGSLAVLWDLAEMTRVELGWFWLACDLQGALYTIRRTGDVAGGGAFESDYLMLIRHARGRLTRIELFELDQLEQALVRFEALRVGDGGGD